MASRKVVLIADDDEFFRIALATILTGKLGFANVVQAASLDEALEKLSADRDISLALFDLKMPGMESAASLRAVRAIFTDLRIAVVSGSSNRQDILAALEAGVHGYVPKILGIADLARALQLVIDGIIYVPPSIAVVPSVEQTRREADGHAVSPLMTTSVTLTPRQHDVLELLVQGKPNKEIARTLRLGEGTVKIHMAALFRTLNVGTRTAAAVAGGRFLARGL